MPTRRLLATTKPHSTCCPRIPSFARAFGFALAKPSSASASRASPYSRRRATNGSPSGTSKPPPMPRRTSACISGSPVGDEEGFADLERAIELADRSSSTWEFCRAKGNLASLYWTTGRLAEGAPLWKEAEDRADQHGQLGMARWLRAINLTVHWEL